MPFALSSHSDAHPCVGADRAAQTIVSPQQALLLVHVHRGSLMLIESAPRFLNLDEIGELGRRVR